MKELRHNNAITVIALDYSNLESHIQLTFPCSKSTTETVEKGVKYV